MNCFIKRVVDSDGVPTNTVLLEPKIPRPPNAFMLYANEKRKSVAQLYPTESNKDISKRLGTSWRALQTHEKIKYYERAKAIDLEHKKKYPNYVYNPKEARIRKAMREATRDRSIGASPMLPRPSARRPSHGWVGAHEELMMSPMSTMRGGGLDCYPMSNGSGNNQFLPPMNSYNKLEASLPPANAMHNSYMQPNPLAQLQQQTEMWNNYPDGIRPRSSGNNSYMMQDVPSAAYQTPTQQAVLQSPLLMEKHQRQTHSTAAAAVATSNNMCMTPPHSNENIPPDEANEKAITKDTPPANDNNNDAFETKHNIETVQPLMESNNVQHHHHHQISDDTQSPYMALYDQQNGGALGGKVEDIKMKKVVKRNIPGVTARLRQNEMLTLPQNHNINKKSINSKPLPDFNEAFGSTERGRFQSPPDPRLAPNKGYLDYFFDSTPIKFDDY